MKIQLRKIATVVILMSLFTLYIPNQINNVEAATINTFQVSPGVIYKDDRFDSGSLKQAARVLEIDLNNNFTQIKPGIPNPLNTLGTTTSIATSNTKENNHVVGAINGSFYHLSSRLPAYLITENNRLLNLGVISTGFDQFMSIPTAFGIKQDGSALIDTYEFQANFEVDGKVTPITSFNKARDVNEIIVYSPKFSYESTRTNSIGMEIVVDNASKSIDNQATLGEEITGTVSKVTSYGGANSVIPKNGYVISIQGGAQSAQFSNVKPGQEINLTINVNDKWKDSNFMLASGPILVKNGEVDMTIDQNSSRARERAPRTAVATDSTGKKVFFVTVDGRQSGYSSGMNLKEFAAYLVSIGAYNALNLDGGGSTTMAVRNYGYIYPTLANSPSDGRERGVSTILQAVSTAPYGEPTILKITKKQDGKLVVGASVDVQSDYILDQYYNSLSATNKAQISYSVEGNIGTMVGAKFVAENSGTGYIVGTSGSSIQKIPVTVVDKPAKIVIEPNSTVLSSRNIQRFTIKAYDSDGIPLIFDPKTVNWSVSGEIGTITQGGILTAGDMEVEGEVIAALSGLQQSAQVKVSNKPVIVDTFNSIENWKSEGARAAADIGISAISEPVFEGESSMKLSYDFTVGEAGIKAAYASAKQPIQLRGKPLRLGVWVYGDGNRHWLRGKINDGSGKEYTINFTEEGKLDWSGWKYITASIPTDVTLPLTFDKLYIAEAYPERQGKGTLYFDKLQAEYSDKYVEPLFKDINNDFWAKNEIKYLVDRNIINGYTNGMFQPTSNLKRVHAAVLLARALKLPLTDNPEPNFKDIDKNHPYYDVISAVTQYGIITGKQNGTIFDPNGTLTRAQMAAILQRAYKLEGTANSDFNDVPKTYWAYKEISALKVNEITTGYQVDNTYKPENPVSRAQFSAFLYRTLTMK